MSNLSLTQRLLLTILTPLVLLWAATTALFLVYGTQALAGATRERGLAIVSFLAPTANYGIVTGNRPDLDQILQAALEQDGVASAAVFDHAGTVVSMRGQPELLKGVTLSTIDNPQLVLEHPGRLAFAAPVRTNPIALGELAYARSQQDMSALVPAPIGWVYVELDTRRLEQQNWNFVLIAFLVALAILSLTALPAIRLARNVGAPVARLADAANHLAEGELDVTIPVGGSGRELQTLERSLNTVAASIANAHHTMRTRIDEATAHLSYQALHDPLTGLLNRRAFEAALDEAVLASRRAADHGTLCFIDLDHFKVINDAGGHAAGDALLQSIAGLIAPRVRAEDMIYRVGGDEFAIILRGCSSADARGIAEGLCKAIGAYRFHWDGQEFQIGASIGLARIDDPDNSTAALLKAADAACYTAKRNGRNCVSEHHHAQST